MRGYAKVSPRIWTGRLGKALRGDSPAQVVALYLISCPHANLIGLYYLPISYISADTGLAEAEVRRSLDRLEEEGFAHYDYERERIWVVDHFRHELGGGEFKPKDKRLAAAASELENHLGSELAPRFGRAYRDMLQAAGCPIPEGPPDSDAPPEGHLDDESAQDAPPEGPPRASSSSSRNSNKNSNSSTHKTRARGEGPLGRLSRDEDSDQEEAFERVWSIYPTKRRKLDAQRAWARTLDIRPPTHLLIAKIQRLADLDAKWARGVIPNLDTWLLGGGWYDEPASDGPPSAPRKPLPPDHDPIAEMRHLARARVREADLEDAAKASFVAWVDGLPRRLDSGGQIWERFRELTGRELA